MDKVVSVVVWEREVYIFMQSGMVYQMYKDHYDLICFRAIGMLPQ